MLPLFDVPDMRNYHLLYAVAGDLLCRSGAHEQARDHFLRAAALTRNSVERTTMQNRASPVRGSPRDVAVTRQLALSAPGLKTVARVGCPYRSWMQTVISSDWPAPLASTNRHRRG